VPESDGQPTRMLERVARAIAVADAADFGSEPTRYLRFATAALTPLLNPTDEMIDVAKTTLNKKERLLPKSEEYRRAIQAMISAIMTSQ
jgi:hypothetical protein